MRRFVARPRRSCGRFRKQGLFCALFLRLRRSRRIRRDHRRHVGQNLCEYVRGGIALVTLSEVMDLNWNYRSFCFAVALVFNIFSCVLGLDLDLRNQAGGLMRVFLQ